MTDLFGSIGGLATALGVTKPGWFAEPDRHLKTILSDPEQRAALIEVVDELLGGEDATATGGRTVVPLAAIEPVRVSATLTERDGVIDIGLLVEVAVPPGPGTVGGRLQLAVPLVATAGEETPAEPLLLGTAHGAIALDVALELPTATAAGPLGLDLRAAEITLRIPTDGALPDLGLALRALKMPGATQPVDIVVAPDDIDDLDTALLQLVLGLVRAQLDAAPAEVRAIAGLLGLVDADGVPDFPIAELLADGPVALARWWARALAEDVRDGWYTHLRTLLGGAAASLDGYPAVDVTLLGSVRLRASVRTAPGAAGLPAVTPVLAVVTDAAPGVELALVVEPVRLDLATGAAVPLPGLRATATVAGAAGDPLLAESVSVGGEAWALAVGSITAGFALTADRSPQFVLAARDVTVGLTQYDLLDLTNADALAEIGGGVLADAADVVLAQLGDVGDALSAMLGLGASGGLAIDPQRLLADPVAAVRDRWRRVLEASPDVVRAQLEPVRDALAASITAVITGDGTAADPYRFALADGIALTAVVDGTRVVVAIEAAVTAPLADEAALRIDARVGLLRADLAESHPTAAVLTDLAAAVAVVPTGTDPLELGDDDTVAVRTRGLGLRVRWRPGTRPDLVPWLREPAVTVAGHAVDLAALREAGVLDGGSTPLADIAGQALDEAAALAESAVRAAEQAAAAWASATADAIAAAVEQLAAGVLGSARSDALAALRELLAWGDDATGGERLALAALIADPAAEMQRWTAAAFGVDPTAGEVVDAGRLLAAVARVARLTGLEPPTASGAVGDPLRLVLPGLQVLAQLAGDDAARLVSRVTGPLEGWVPGDALPSAADLLAGLTADAGIDDALGDALAGRALSPAAIDGIMARWAGTDGVVGAATAALPAGLDLHRIAGLVHGAPLAGPAVQAALTGVLGGTPARLVLVGVEAVGEPDLLPARDDPATGLDVDLTAAGAPAASFPRPGPAPAGLTVVRLAGKTSAVETGTTPSTESGFDAQVARLRPILAGLASGDDVVVVAGGAAGRVAVAAAEGSAVTTVITVGTPWSPIALGDVDSGPAAEGLRLLASLADLGIGPDAGDDADPVDETLQRGRDLVAALLGRDVRGDPLTELTAPAREVPAGLDVRALIGQLDADQVRAAVTALVRRALDVRSAARTAVATAADALSRAGVRIPLEWGTVAGGIRVRLETDLDLGAIAAAAAAGDDVPRRIGLRLRVWADGRWLVGGPDPGRAPGPRPLALRAVTFEAELPLPPFGGAPARGAAPGTGRIVLHDALVFGIRRTRRHIDLSDAGALLPELRALLGEVAAALHSRVAADPAAAALVDLLGTLGIVDSHGGFDPVTLTTLLADPAAVLRTALGSPGPRQALAAALRGAAGDSRADAGTTVRWATAATTIEVDLETLSVAGSLHIAAAAPAAPAIEATLQASPAGAALRLGLGWVSGLAVTLGVTADSAGALQVTAGLALGPDGTELLPLWPPDAAAATGVRLGEAALRIARDAALQLGARALRQTLATAAPARELIDGVLDAVALLTPADATGARDLVWPGPLLADPGAWLADRAGGLAAATPRLLQAAAAALGVPGATPGSLAVADGLELSAVATADGGLRLGVRLAADRFADVPGFLLAIDAAAVIRPGARPVPAATITVGTAAGALEVGLAPDAGGVGLTVMLRPQGSGALTLYPGVTGFGAAAQTAATAAVQAALPWLLTQLAGHVDDADEAVRIAARVAARVGRALGLAGESAGSVVFDPDAFRAFIDTPAAALQAALGSAVTEALALLRDAAQELFGLGDAFEVTATAGVLSLTTGPASARVSLSWDTGGGTLAVGVASDAVAVVGPIRGHAVVASTGVQAVTVAVGPTPLDFGAITVTPLARFSWTPEHTAVELGLAAGDTSRVVARLSRTAPAPWGFALVAETGPIDPATLRAASDAILDDAAAVAAALARAVLGLAADVVLALEPVDTFLDSVLPVGGVTVRDVLDGVVLAGGDLDLTLLDDLDDAGRLLGRLGALAANLVPALPAIPIGAGMGIGIFADAGVLGFRLDVAAETPLNDGDDVIVSLVADAAWIDREPAGVRVGIVRLTDDTAAPALSIEVRGIGIRFSRRSGPLLDAGLRIGSVRLLTYAHITDDGGALDLGGGVSVSLEGLGLALGGGGDGSNPIAEGVMPSGGAADDAPRPAFSPTLDIIKRPTDAEVQVAVRAGTVPGPWWLTIQREFGPIYLEQVGLDVTTADGSIASISILIDGAVSLFGFAAAVDDLSLTYRAPGSVFEPRSWAVDVAGFAISADVAGLTLAGGLRKFTPGPGGVEYLGMLLARFGTYGLTVYGGFSQVGPPEDQYLSMFLIGGVNGPIGGVPAFFVTGIAGGFGVNRRLVVPTDLDRFPSFALIRALDSAAADVDPFVEIERLRTDFPAERGSFWFAAGLSFNSFVLVDGIVVVGIEFGNGFELSILGLARLSLPRPQVTLINIELALVARVSSREGIVLVQAQLTDNSWLLNPSVRLTGGFAFAAWFAGPNKGQFVLTMGGYHPDFHRDGYPVVPRLGIEWRIGDWIVISGKSYFALTSEALMAGVKIEIHAVLGPAWAHVVLGADAIIYFDPFWLNATVYASIDAGITIDVWIGEITLSVHIGARITLEGPPFHAIGTLEIGPASVTLEIGPSSPRPAPLDWPSFLAKYLEDAGDGTARALAAITGAGAVPPAGGATGGGAPAPDGQPDRPFQVIAEFEITLTSTVPFARYEGARLATAGAGDAGGTVDLPQVPNLAVAPMHKDGVKPRLTLSVRRRAADGTATPGENYQTRPGITGRHSRGDFPYGVWGPVPDTETVPEGELITAPNTVALTFTADMTPFGTPPAIPYHQVRTGPRRVLPLLPSIASGQLTVLRQAAATTVTAVAALRAAHPGEADTAIAQRVLAERGGLGALRAADWQARLAAPVRLGSLGEDIGRVAPDAGIRAVAPPNPAGTAPARAARVAAVLAAPAVSDAVLTGVRGRPVGTGTSVSAELLARVVGNRGPAPTMTAPTLAAVVASVDAAVPTRLVRAGSVPVANGKTVLTVARTATMPGLSRAASVATRTTGPEALRTLRLDDAALTGDGLALTEGQVVLLELPDGARDAGAQRPSLRSVAGPARVIVLGGGGTVLGDVHLTGRRGITIPVGARAVAVIAGPAAPMPSGLAVLGGWHDTSLLPATGGGALIGTGCVLNAVGRFAAREADAAVPWTTPAALTQDRAPTTTTLRSAGEGRAMQAIAVGVTGTGSDGVAVGLENAEPVGDPFVTTDPDGASIVIIAVRERGTGPVIVNAAIDETRDVTGVFAASAPAADDPAATAALFAKAIAARGLRALDRPVAAAGPAVTRLRWSTP